MELGLPLGQHLGTMGDSRPWTGVISQIAVNGQSHHRGQTSQMNSQTFNGRDQTQLWGQSFETLEALILGAFRLRPETYPL